MQAQSVPAPVVQSGQGRRGRRMRAGAAAVLCGVACLAAVTVLFPANSDGGAAELQERLRALHKVIGSSKIGSLDARLHKILEAEHTAAGAIDVLWDETNQLPAVSEEKRWRNGPKIGTLPGDEAVGATWSSRMARYLRSLNELTLPEAEQIAPSNLDFHLYQDKQSQADAFADHLHKDQDQDAAEQGDADSAQLASALSLQTPLARPAPRPSRATPEQAAKTAIRAAAAARVDKAVNNVKKQVRGTQQLAAKPHTTFFQDALQNLAGAKKRRAHSHLKGRMMMLAEAGAPEGGERGDGSEASDTDMAIEDAMQDEGMGKEEQLGDTLKGNWHSPMWPGGTDEGSPVLTSTIAAPGQGGEYAYGFPYDEAQLFSLSAQPGGNGTAGTGSAGTDDASGGAEGDVVEAAEKEGEEEERKAGAQQANAAPFYEGVGAGAQLGPDSPGGWGDRGVPPPMPGDEDREKWLHDRANGYSDEFYGAAKRLRDQTSEKAMAQENADDEAIDGQQGLGLDPKISSLRERIGKFVGAMQSAGVVKPDYALRSLEKQQEPKESTGKVQQDQAAMPGAQQSLALSKGAVGGKTTRLSSSDSSLTDSQFLAKFKPPTVDEGEDYPCGWPGPACADPGGEATSGGFLGGGGSKSFYGIEAKSMKDAALSLNRERLSQLTAIATAAPSASASASLSAQLQAPLHFKGRSEKGNADEATPLL